MKKASGELSNTVVVLVCVAILIAFFYYVVWPIINQNFVSQTACEKATCETKPDSNGLVKCALPDKKTGQMMYFYCKYKG